MRIDSFRYLTVIKMCYASDINLTTYCDVDDLFALPHIHSTFAERLSCAWPLCGAYATRYCVQSFTSSGKNLLKEETGLWI